MIELQFLFITFILGCIIYYIVMYVRDQYNTEMVVFLELVLVFWNFITQIFVLAVVYDELITPLLSIWFIFP